MEHLPRARAVHSAYSCVDDRNLKGEEIVKAWPHPPCVCAHLTIHAYLYTLFFYFNRNKYFTCIKKLYKYFKIH